MMFSFFQFINGILIVLYITQTIYKYRKYNISYICSPLCWFMIFYCAYFMIPVLLLRTVIQNPHLFGYFIFSERTMVMSQIIVVMESMILVTLHAGYVPQKRSDGFTVLSRTKSIYILCELIIGVFVATSCFSLLAIIRAIQSNGYIKAFFILDALGDKYRKLFKFQTVRYLSVICVFYLFLKKQKFSLFLTFVPNMLFEVLAGKRTTAFLYVFFAYITYVKVYAKSRLLLITSVFTVLLASVLFSRMGTLNDGNLSFDVIVASMLAEFINTFLTLPYILENNLICSLSVPHVLYNVICPVLPGSLRASIMHEQDFKEVGALLAEHIGKGFGLGSNCISYDIYTFGFTGLLCLPCIFVLIWAFDRSLSKDCNFMIRFFFIYQLRLYMRQGYESLAIILYIVIFYNSLFYFFHRKHRYEIVMLKKSCIAVRKRSFDSYIFSS